MDNCPLGLIKNFIFHLKKCNSNIKHHIFIIVEVEYILNFLLNIYKIICIKGIMLQFYDKMSYCISLVYGWYKFYS